VSAVRIQLRNNNYRAKVGVGGGPVTYLTCAIPELVRRGHQVSILCRTPNGGPPTVEREDDATIYYHEAASVPDRLWMVEPLLLGLRLRRIVRRYASGVDLVLARNYHYAYATATATRQPPMIYVAPGNPHRETLLDMAASTPRERLYRRFLALQTYRMERAALRGARHVVVFSEMKRRETIDGYGIAPEHISVAWPGYPEPAPGGTEAASLREQLGIPSNAFVVLSLCRLAPHKNLGLLLHAFARLRDRTCHLLVVGDGVERPRLERLARELGVDARVRFTGRQREIGGYYALSNAYVLPSLYEAFGFSYLEAMAAGLPCIGVRADYPRIVLPTEEIIEHGVTGFCIGNDEGELAAVLEQLIDDGALCRRLGEAARRRCHDRYQWPRHFERVLGLTSPRNGASPAFARGHTP
jgi:glycosyltransferase involved in cell wall biosynthesis